MVYFRPLDQVRIEYPSRQEAKTPMRCSQFRILLPVALAVVIAGCGNGTPADTPSAAAPTEAQMVARGEMLIIGGLCHDCHTTKILGPEGPRPDMSQMLGGHPQEIGITFPFQPADGSPWTIATNDTLTAWSGPWGVSFGANLTPDENTGIGIWTEEMFISALRTGRHMGVSRPILPPMPWEFIAQLSDDDLRAMFAYLQSIPPISNRVPVPLGPDGRPIEEP
jgi:mono/diheme cytochrome c family protein